MAVWSTVLFSELEGAFRIDPEFYKPHYLNISSQLKALKYTILDNISKISDGDHSKLPDIYDHGKRYLRAKDLQNLYIDDSDPIYISEDYFEKIRRSHIKPNDILLSIMGTIGNIAVVPDNSEIVTANRAVSIIRLKNNSGFDPYFVAAYLDSNIGVALRERESQGGIQQRINLEALKRIKIPLLSEKDQLKVRENIASGLKKRQESIALYTEAESILMHELGLDSLDLSPQIAHTANFSETMEARRLDAEYFQPKYQEILHHLSENWSVECIDDLGKVLKGWSVGGYSETGVPVIRSGDLTDIDNLDKLKYANPNKRLFYLQKGDICVSSIGFGSIGKVQVFDKDEKFATVSEVTVIRQHRVNPYYLQIFLQSPAGQLQIERQITGATGQLHLYPKDVGQIIVPILPPEKQVHFEKVLVMARQAKYDSKIILEEAKNRVEEMIHG